MVPGAIDADLHLIASELIVLAGKLCQPVRRINDPAIVRLQPVAVDVADMPERRVRAHRTGSRDVVSYVLRRSHELGMSIANVCRGQPASPQSRDHRPARQAVVHGWARRRRGRLSRIERPAEDGHTQDRKRRTASRWRGPLLSRPDAGPQPVSEGCYLDISKRYIKAMPITGDGSP